MPDFVGRCDPPVRRAPSRPERGDLCILQHAVDAHAAQTAAPYDTPITMVFALVGLYLLRHVDGQELPQRSVRLGIVITELSTPTEQAQHERLPDSGAARPRAA